MWCYVFSIVIIIINKLRHGGFGSTMFNGGTNHQELSVLIVPLHLCGTTGSQ